MKQKILFVDDEQMICELAKDFLENKGYEVIVAHDGKKGLQEARKIKPDLIVLDVNMPRMDGFQVLDQLKKDSKTMTIPVFMLTTRKADEDIQEGMEKMADKYLPKPFLPAVLAQEIEKTLAFRSA